MLTCDIDERWNGPPPRCEPIECDELPDEYENAKIVSINGTIEYGSKAEIVCPLGFKPDGPRYISCLSTGQWSVPLAPCIRGNVIINTIRLQVSILAVINVHISASFQTKRTGLDVRVSIPPQTTPATTTRKSIRTSSRYTTTPVSTTEYDDGKWTKYVQLFKQ